MVKKEDVALAVGGLAGIGLIAYLVAGRKPETKATLDKAVIDSTRWY